MSSFKQKPNKLKYITDTITLDEIHKNYVNEFQENKKSLPQKRKKLRNLMRELESSSNLDLSDRAKIMNSISVLENEIKMAEEENESLEYMSKAGDLLINYYNITSSVYYNSEGLDNSTYIQNTESITEHNTDNTIQTNNTNNTNTSNDIEITTESCTMSSRSKNNKASDKPDKLKELNELSKLNRKLKKPVKKRKIEHNVVVSKTIFQYLPVKESEEETLNKEKNPDFILNRATLQHKFLMIVDSGYACGKVKANKIVYCPVCNIEKILDQSGGCYVCKKCGDYENVIMESELPSHKELANEKQKYPYKKINHLKEKLNQFQSKESADVPDEICNIVKNDLRKRGILPKKSNPLLIRKILKKHKLTDWYEHLQQIYCKISGSPPITLSNEIEETIINMFQAMQESFRNHCPSHRSNFLSYSYVLNKLFKILNMPNHSKYFGLLKSKEKLREQDIIWAKICKDLGWKFHSSFT